MPEAAETTTVSIDLGEINPGFEPNGNEVDPKKKTSGTLPPRAVGFKDVTYTVKIPVPCKCGKGPTFDLLKSASGIFPAGNLNAIIGHNAASKTGLIEALAGHTRPNKLKGSFYDNGNMYLDNFRHTVGYVPKDNLFIGTQTTREAVSMAVALRLSLCGSQSLKDAKVEDALRVTKMVNSADEKLGFDMIEPLSNLRRKCAKLAMEYAVSPSLIFMDDPFAGLSYSDQVKLLNILRSITDDGGNVILSCTAVPYGIYKKFNTICVLAETQVVFQGNQSDVLQHFEHLGFDRELEENPADFIISILEGHARNKSAIEKKTFGIEASLVEAYKQTSSQQRVLQDLDGMVATKGKSQNTSDNKPSVNAQMKWLSRRQILLAYRNPRTGIIGIVALIVIGIISGLVFLRLDDHPYNALKNRLGACTFNAINMLFGQIPVAEIYHSERAALHHEIVSGFYGPGAYVVSKLFCDLLPQKAGQSFILATITYFMIGFRLGADRFFIWWLCLFSVAFTSSTFALFIGASVQTGASANAILTLCFLVMLLFTGSLRTIPSMPDWYRWLEYFSIPKYGIRMQTITEFSRFQTCLPGPGVNGTRICDPLAGEGFLRQEGIQNQTPWDMWQNLVALVAISFGLCILSYIQIRRLQTRH